MQSVLDNKIKGINVIATKMILHLKHQKETLLPANLHRTALSVFIYLRMWNDWY
ncbi:hypothetical protein BAZMOX_144645_0 [methanotrophic endosymbiont of Bathymodiolus azoricus (Menez Gwen)]|nr:hypothetical protein BAZMOX_144645_0 [methanotrophic endosymbiont of Bathymodiolus azoricus (Menez Gwen)]